MRHGALVVAELMGGGNDVGEKDDIAARLSDTEILHAFRDAIVALSPILLRLDAIEVDTQAAIVDHCN